MNGLFSELQIRKVTFKNRIFCSPMCQYSSIDGMPTDWHFVHLGSRAVGGAGLIIVEATAVSPEARITPQDSGIWSDDHAKAFKRITSFLREQGCVPGIQLAHAGRKASVEAPWNGGGPVKDSSVAWQTVGPSPIAFDPSWPRPKEMTKADIDKVISDFEKATKRSLDAGFDVIELHFAHGYLFHEFLSPLSNQRKDEYGGSLENRMRLPLEVAERVRKTWPQEKPLFVRISATDWSDNGWDLEQSIELCKKLKALNIDMIDCSSGGNIGTAKIPVGASYQVEFAAAIRERAKIATIAVGMITQPEQAESIVRTGQADAVCLARELLRDPYWPQRAAQRLHKQLPWPQQYDRAKPT